MYTLTLKLKGGNGFLKPQPNSFIVNAHVFPVVTGNMIIQ